MDCILPWLLSIIHSHLHPELQTTPDASSIWAQHSRLWLYCSFWMAFFTCLLFHLFCGLKQLKRRLNRCLRTGAPGKRSSLSQRFSGVQGCPPQSPSKTQSPDSNLDVCDTAPHRHQGGPEMLLKEQHFLAIWLWKNPLGDEPHL